MNDSAYVRHKTTIKALIYILNVQNYPIYTIINYN
jgi:hypothetical protein